jgi:hypothetical protein
MVRINPPLPNVGFHSEWRARKASGAPLGMTLAEKSPPGFSFCEHSLF